MSGRPPNDYGSGAFLKRAGQLYAFLFAQEGQHFICVFFADVPSLTPILPNLR